MSLSLGIIISCSNEKKQLIIIVHSLSYTHVDLFVFAITRICI